MMKFINEIRELFREKSGKKLLFLSVAVFLVLTAVMFFTVYRIYGINSLNEIDEYLEAIPDLFESRRKDMDLRTRAYEGDILSRAEIGMLTLQGENGLPDAQGLEQVRLRVSADSVSLLDEKGKLLLTTGAVCPEETFNNCIQALEPGTPHLEFYPAVIRVGEKNDNLMDGKGFVRLPVPGGSACSLVYEFPCDNVMSMFDFLTDWAEYIQGALKGGEAALFAKIGDRLEAYMEEGFTSEELDQITEKLNRIFQKKSALLRTSKGRAVKFIRLLGKMYLAVQTYYEQEQTDLLMMVPFRSAVGNALCIALSISTVIALGMMMFLLYASRRLQRNREGSYTDAARGSWIVRATRPGILLVLVVTFAFSEMLLELENRTHANISAMGSRVEIQNEIALRKSHADRVRSNYSGYYLKRAEILASFLMDHPEYQTHAGLGELSRIAGTNYLMRFDSAGKETLSSNTYTGFSTDTSPIDRYRAVQMGYPHIVTEPAADPYTGQMQMGAAVLMTDAQGQPDGFLLAVYSAAELKNEYDRMSEVNTINDYVVNEGKIVAAIDDKDGIFIAHTNPRMIGQKASTVFAEYEPGAGYEGFAQYNGENVCVSARSEDGKTIAVIVPQKMDAEALTLSYLAGFVLLLVLLLVYQPKASRLVAQGLEEGRGVLQPADLKKSPMMIFFDGYPIFLTAFVIAALLLSAAGLWSSFDYVFSWQWNKGVNLFSIWASIFIVAVTLCVKYAVFTVLDQVEKRLGFENKTYSSLIKSLVVYATILFLGFFILSILGVNTTALLASAGIISIAAGMGAQSMAADLLAGFFMILDGSIHVGDYVSVGGVTGHVTDMGIRTTEITDDKGNIILLNNSKVNPVCNMTGSHEQAKKKTTADETTKK